MKNKERDELVKKSIADIRHTLKSIKSHEDIDKLKGEDLDVTIMAIVFTSIESLIDGGVLELKK